MSFYNNSNFQNNFSSNSTFQGPPSFGPPAPYFEPPAQYFEPIPSNSRPLTSNLGPLPPPPPPPPPPPCFLPMVPSSSISEQDFIKQFEKPTQRPAKFKFTNLSINKVKEDLSNLVLMLNNLKQKEKYLKDNIDTIPREEWTLIFTEIRKNKHDIDVTLSQMDDMYLNTLKKLVTKRSAKRMRLKRLREERQKEKQEWIRQRQEKSRKIDEDLQKIKDEIEKAEQEEKAKLKADAVLKEVLRKKQDAKKCFTKLEAMQKLYKARQNTARGRGEVISEQNAANFNGNIEKLKAVWAHKLRLYEKEESELRVKLNQDNEVQKANVRDEVVENLDKWKEFLFGESSGPQVDFQGNIEEFIATRSQWDQYISDDGSPLPVGWVVPNLT